MLWSVYFLFFNRTTTNWRCEVLKVFPRQEVSNELHCGKWSVFVHFSYFLRVPMCKPDECASDCTCCNWFKLKWWSRYFNQILQSKTQYLYLTASPSTEKTALTISMFTRNTSRYDVFCIWETFPRMWGTFRTMRRIQHLVHAFPVRPRKPPKKESESPGKSLFKSVCCR